MKNKTYTIRRNNSTNKFNSHSFWRDVPKISIDTYLWKENDYKPSVTAKACYTAKYLIIYFNASESEITARFKNINDYVHKDSCVELFINLFPHKTEEYFNFEKNPLGTMHVGFGAIGNRTKVSEEEIKQIDFFSSVDKPTIGKHNGESWEVYFKIPLSIFEGRYNHRFSGESAKGNFYKCGDESKFEHYGC